MATTKPPRNDAQRKAAQRARYKKNGLARLEVWARPEHHERIKNYAARLRSK